MLSWLADQMIEEAMKRGEFDDLPGKGKPLELEDLSHVPEELRSAYKLMKNANIMPEELTLRQEMLTLSDLIAACQQDEERLRLRKKLDEKTLRLNMLTAQKDWSSNSAYNRYESKIRQRLTGW
ncbi:DnaJ family domain-containing protein [Paenibacillus hunanensis]|uniref:DnaJ family domain-containing protein n=1 Tax=Paenibacillus hunanensis TaxID=539262 RepID=UPI002A69DB31|nr:DnaJ family domain-containing protein [Paenibacillus hunanensis]WPP39618.1 DnaJ family domain-containing protein [Paenibacillus hunanensis]